MSAERYQVVYFETLNLWNVRDTLNLTTVDSWGSREAAATSCDAFNNGSHPRSEIRGPIFRLDAAETELLKNLFKSFDYDSEITLYEAFEAMKPVRKRLGL